MKRYLIIILTICLSLTLSGCNKGSDDLLISDEFNRISLLIPNEFEDDILLPSVAESFVVVYLEGGEEIEDNILVYELLTSDKNIILEIRISYEDDEEIFYFAITQKGKEVLIDESEIDILFDRVFYQIDYQILDVLVSNQTLPSIFEDFVTVSYSVDCAEIVRNRIVYTFPNTTEYCYVTAVVTYNGETRERNIPFEMSAFDNLPKIPELHITTTNNQEITSGEVYLTGTLDLVVNGNFEFKTIVDAKLSIRLRGNSTLYMPKLSFRIKFVDKQNLFSDYEERNWVLLANHVDQTLLRDYLAFSMSTKLNMAFSPAYKFVDVYVNGVYQGNYLLTDQIEVTNDRVNIEENVPEIDTGYLVEYDQGLYRIGLDNTDDNYFLIDGIPFVIKSPEYDDPHYSPEHKEYISNYFETVLDTLKNQRDYSDLIDESTFIDWFIVNEVFKNVDSGYSSVYFYKDKGGLLKMGPVWDFDISSGVPGYVSEELRGPTGWWTARQDKNVFLYYLMEYPSFRQNLKDRWNEVYERAIFPVLDEVFYAADSITHSRYNNFELWDIIGKDESWYTSPEILAIKTYDEQIWFLYDYLKIRIEWLDREINKLD